LRAAARAAGMNTLREDGFRKVACGLTSISEVLRVTLRDEA
jgi:type II secretory ATPase GspE/PulE/Tfp pilus assembly ATPase PilB-like protein